MLFVRRIGLAILAIAAIAVFYIMAPEVPDDSAGAAFVSLVDLAKGTNELNSGRTESAPQQQVVNGWYANDLLEIIALENARSVSQGSDDRQAALLVIGVLAIALWGTTAITRQPDSGPMPTSYPQSERHTAETTTSEPGDPESDNEEQL